MAFKNISIPSAARRQLLFEAPSRGRGNVYIDRLLMPSNEPVNRETSAPKYIFIQRNHKKAYYGILNKLLDRHP